jgi:Fe(3+) dicitrate transport protein
MRSRNWFDLQWATPAISLNYTINEHSRWNTKLFATLGNRNSVGFTAAITTPDSIRPSTLGYNHRILNADTYRNYAIESRLLLDYSWGKQTHALSTGIRMYTGNTHRYSNGKGTIGKDYDMTLIGKYPNNIVFTSNNAALFAENMFRLRSKWLIVPGIRLEWLKGSASGQNGFNTDGSPILLQNISKSRTFLLAGVGTEYHVNEQREWYGNITQAYRPIQFANLQAAPTTDQVDPNLKDAKGYNIDLGYRGKVKNWMRFDASVFYLNYRNRIGTIIPVGENYRLITNVGNSHSMGFEGFAEISPISARSINSAVDLRIFINYSYTQARYSNNHQDAATKGKKVENAPAHIARAGWHVSYRSVLFTTQWSYVDKTFSDANNTLQPSSNGQTGLIPAYTIVDCSTQINCSSSIVLKAGLNNVFNVHYFTRRAGGYPGPGLLPGDGRNYFVTLSATL